MSEPAPWYAAIPRALLIAALSSSLGLIAWAGSRWIQMVDNHISMNIVAFERIRALEVHGERMAEEIRALHVDQVEQALYRARRERDAEREKELEHRLSILESRP